MAHPLIAIVGSIDAKRNNYEQPLENTDDAQTAAEEIGRELAKAGCRIVVYSGATGFLEPLIVKGYISSGVAKDKSIQVRFPFEQKAASFPEYEKHKELFDFMPDSNSDWEVSFYRSLSEVGGVLLMGGGRSTFITGHIALGFHIPLLAIATFGGSAKKVWEALSVEIDSIDNSEKAIMASVQWEPVLAHRCVKSLLSQNKRIAESNEKRKRGERTVRWEGNIRSLLALVLLVATIVVLPVGYTIDTWFKYLLFLSPILAGASGSTFRMLWTSQPSFSAFRTTVLGAGSGAIAAILYVAAQLVANPQLLDASSASSQATVFPLLVFAVVTGFIAGFTFDTVYKKLAQADAVKLDAFTESNM